MEVGTVDKSVLRECYHHGPRTSVGLATRTCGYSHTILRGYRNPILASTQSSKRFPHPRDADIYQTQSSQKQAKNITTQ
jgi:hypothetical protein